MNKEELKNWLKSTQFPKNITIGETKYKLLDIESRHIKQGNIRLGKQGFIFKAENKYGSIKAIKFSLDNKDPVGETILANKLGTSDLFVIPETVKKEYKLCEYNFNCFVQPWVNGDTLGHLIRHRQDEVTSDFVKTIMLSLLQAIALLYRRGLQHDDLHLNNIMLEEPDVDMIVGGKKPPVKLKIIDTGCMRFIKSESKRGSNKRDDFYHFVSTAIHLRNTLFNNRRLYVNSIEFIKALDKFIIQLNDEDIARTWGFTSTTSSRDKFDVIWSKLNEISIENKIYKKNSSQLQLTHPFEAMSVEFFSSNQLVVDLFIKNTYWYENIVSKEPTILTGPRGCGKSMVFRYLATNTHLQNKNSDISKLNEIPFLGIYINCSQDLQAYLFWMKDKVDDTNKLDYKYYHDGIITFFSLLVCSRLVLTLHKISLNESALNKYQTSKEKIKNIIKFITKRIKSNNTFVLPRTTEALNLYNILDIAKFEIRSALLEKEDHTNTKLPFKLDESFVSDVSKHCYENLNESHPVVFLLDDYTYGRIPESVQKILNKIIWQRTKYQHFKVSSEKLNLTKLNSYGVTADTHREYEEIDTGNNAFSNLKNQKFITEMLDLRFKSASWKGRVDTLIGLSEHSKHTELKKAIIKSSKSSGHYYYYHGIEVIANLWTGDTATTLQIVNKITEGKDKDSTSIVNKEKQHEAIEGISKTYVQHIENFHPYGVKLKAICSSFGFYMHKRLIQDKVGIPRIEFSLNSDEDVFKLLENKNKEASEIAKELIKRTIFIDIGLGKAKEENKPNTVRWQFKKIYYPANKVSYGKDGYLGIKNIDEFVDFLIEPGTYLENKIKNKINDTKQGRLFDDEQATQTHYSK